MKKDAGISRLSIELFIEYSSNLYYGPAWGFHSDEQKYIIGMSLSPRELLADRDYQKDLRTAIYYIAAEVKLKRTN